jgi:diguanylate cyclase
MRDDGQLEQKIDGLLADPQFEGHPLREALAALFQQYHDHLMRMERITSISDHYQSAVRERNQSISARYDKQLRQLLKIVRISDHYQEMLHDLNQKLRVASMQDALTGLPNRRLMLDRLNAETTLAARQGTVFSLALIDIDHFKQVNDWMGHDVGDATLIEVARALSTGARPYDVCARWGGEEFLLLLPHTTGPSALEVAGRLRMKVEMLEHPKLPDPLRVSVSIGVAEHRPTDSLEATIKRADLALYEAKRSGRNHVVLSE